MRFIEQARFESTLPHMACLDVTRIELKGKCPMDSLKGSAQCSFLVRDCDVMNVVRHETVCPDPNLFCGAVFDDEIQVDSAIGVIEKDFGFSIATLGQMV